MTSSLTAPHALVGEEKPSQPAHQQPRYFAPQSAVELDTPVTTVPALKKAAVVVKLVAPATKTASDE